jgi:hypothetical protein
VAGGGDSGLRSVLAHPQDTRRREGAVTLSPRA